MSKVYFSEYKQDANGALKDCADMDFDTVVIIGIKESQVHLRTSLQEDTLVVLGALEAAKDHILKTW